MDPTVRSPSPRRASWSLWCRWELSSPRSPSSSGWGRVQPHLLCLSLECTVTASSLKTGSPCLDGLQALHFFFFFSETLTRPTDEFIYPVCTVWLFLFQGTTRSMSSTVLQSWTNSLVSVLSARPWGLESCLREFQNSRMLELDDTSALPWSCHNLCIDGETEAQGGEGFKKYRKPAFPLRGAGTIFP